MSTKRVKIINGDPGEQISPGESEPKQKSEPTKVDPIAEAQKKLMESAIEVVESEAKKEEEAITNGAPLPIRDQVTKDGQEFDAFLKSMFKNQICEFEDGQKFFFDQPRVRITDKKLSKRLRKVMSKYHIVEA